MKYVNVVKVAGLSHPVSRHYGLPCPLANHLCWTISWTAL